MQVLSYTEVVAAGRKAWEEGTLGALAGEKNCLYQSEVNPKVHCVVGAALTEETLQKLTI